MLFIVVMTFLVWLLCSLFGIVLGIKAADLTGVTAAACLGPLTALALGLAFGCTHLPLAAGIVAGAAAMIASAACLMR